MIEVYKYQHGQYNVDVSFLPRTENSNRGHSLKLQKQSSQLKVRHDFFSLRVVDLWNSLPESVVSAPAKIRSKTVWINSGRNTNSMKKLRKLRVTIVQRM